MKRREMIKELQPQIDDIIKENKNISKSDVEIQVVKSSATLWQHFLRLICRTPKVRIVETFNLLDRKLIITVVQLEKTFWQHFKQRIEEMLYK